MAVVEVLKPLAPVAQADLVAAAVTQTAVEPEQQAKETPAVPVLLLVLDTTQTAAAVAQDHPVAQDMVHTPMIWVVMAEPGLHPQ